MTKSFRRNVCLVAGTVMLGLSSLNAEVIYSNTTNDLTRRFTFDPTILTEIGDQIVLTSTGFLTNFAFEYWGSGSAEGQSPFAGNVEARVQFYRMDGAPTNGFVTPGTSFYDSGWFSVGATERSTMRFVAGTDFSPTGLFIPVTEITWSVQFRNLLGGDRVGLDIFSPPTVGQNYPDYWGRDTLNNWTLLGEEGVPMNFAARFEANIPEPSAISLLLFGGLAAFVFRRRMS